MRSLKITNSITERTFLIEKYFNDVSSIPMIDQEKEVELAQKIKKGDKDAENELVRANLRFVISCAKKYQNRGLSLEELIAEGNVGLIKAAQRFDETRGFKFISYAVSWVRQSILESILKHGKTIRLPQNRIQQQHRLLDLVTKKIQENNGFFSVDEVCRELNIDHQTFNILYIVNKSTSLDTQINNDSETTLLDILNNDENNPEDYVAINTRKNQIQTALSSLTDIEKEVIMLSYGLNKNNREFTNNEIATQLDFSSERIRQIKNTALKKLKISLKRNFGSEISF
jgi:RNA polymerase primary sigma factor